MDPVRKLAACGVLLGTLASAAAKGADQVPTSPAGLALESVFNPQRAPSQKTMGLLQRNFLDMLESSEQELQVAFVIDGTNSMAADIAGVRDALHNMVADLKQYKGDHVSFSLVVYRDLGAPSGEISLPFNQFTSDEKVLSDAFAKIQPETGEPYFLELPDLGVHEALDKLNWTEGEETSRWLLLFGDAPPYESNFKDTQENGGAQRRFETDLLVELAQRKGVQVSCVLCTSRQEERVAYEKVLDRTRQFMNTLSTNTGGLMLDLSYPDIQAALLSAAKKTRVERQRIGSITREDIEAARQAAAAAQQPVSLDRRLRVAVVPHIPFDQMTFDPSHEAVQMAAELRQKLRGMSRTEVLSPVDVDRALRRVSASKVQPAQMLQALALQLRADYVVWGNLRRMENGVSVQTAVYSKKDGEKIAATSMTSGPMVAENELAGNILDRLTFTNIDQKRAPDLHLAFSEYRTKADLREQLIRPVANNVESRSDLLTGFESLEQALALPVGDENAARLLEQAEQSLNRAAAADLRNPFTHVLLASCYFNQAQAALAKGNAEQAKTASQQHAESLKRAYSYRDDAPVELVKIEIAADYQLLVKKDFPEAVKLYSELATKPNDSKLHTALRAHWMLAGIYSGDWGVSPNTIDPVKARVHLVHILAHWPDSTEAAFIKANLRWSEEKGRNQFEHFPLVNTF